MTAATVSICGRCGHPERLHSEEYGCDNSACGCTAFRDDGKTAPVRAVPTPSPAAASLPPRGAAAVPPPVSGPSVEQLLAAGKRSPSKRMVALAERIEGQIRTLASALRDERQAAEAKRRVDIEKEAARREVVELETRLAAARAKLTGRTPPQRKTDVATGEHSCTRPGCDRTFATSQARAMHERRAHDGFDPRSAKAG